MVFVAFLGRVLVREAVPVEVKDTVLYNEGDSVAECVGETVIEAVGVCVRVWLLVHEVVLVRVMD